MFGELLNFVGGFLDRDAQRDANNQNADLQREFAQRGIRWRVEDAKAAGLHPLAAIGMNPSSASPSYQVGGSMADSFRSAGNVIDRARETTSTESERLANRLLESQIQGQDIDNAMKASNLARLSGPQLSPPFPGEVLNPSEVTRSRTGDVSTEAGRPAPAVKEFINRDGSVTVWPSSDAKQSIEDSLYEYEHMYRNRVLPSLSPVGDFLFENVVEPFRSISQARRRRRQLRY